MLKEGFLIMLDSKNTFVKRISCNDFKKKHRVNDVFGGDFEKLCSNGNLVITVFVVKEF